MHLFTKNQCRWEAVPESVFFGQGVGLDVNGQKCRKSLWEREQDCNDITLTFEGTRTRNRFTQIRNDTTLNTCNISHNVRAGNGYETGGSRSDTIGSKGSCDAAKSHG